MLRPVIEKSALAKLRKNTGYSFSKCKEALEKHSNDLSQAEKWLKEQAQTHGWEKATKLQGRATAQGLISVLASPTNAVMVETNCETDFVSRNKKFQHLVQKITQGCYHFSAEQPEHTGKTMLSSVPLSGDQLANLPLAESRPIKDETAVSIGEVGENIKNRRAVSFRATAPVRLAGFTHPLPEGTADKLKDVVQMGRYGAIVAFKPTGQGQETRNQSRMQEIGRQLCQHIVGMNPREIGQMKSKLEPPPEAEAPAQPAQPGQEGDIDPTVQLYPESDETTLLNQEFLLDPDVTVGEFLLENAVEVLDFIRYECGEEIESSHHG